MIPDIVLLATGRLYIDLNSYTLIQTRSLTILRVSGKREQGWQHHKEEEHDRTNADASTQDSC